MLLRPSRLGDSSHAGQRDTAERGGLLNTLLSPSHPRCFLTLIPKAKWTPWKTLCPKFCRSPRETVFRDHRCNGSELGQTPGNGEGQGSLACCSQWGRKELDMTWRLNKNNRDTLKVLETLSRKEGIKHSWRMSRCQFRPERKTRLPGWIDEDE